MDSSMKSIHKDKETIKSDSQDLSHSPRSEPRASVSQRRLSQFDLYQGDDTAIFTVKNLDTGESLDMRNENSVQFPESYTRVIGEEDGELDVKEFL